MRLAAVFVSLFALAVGRADDKPLTPAEAAKKISEKVTVEMEVKSTGGKTSCYLNSEADFKKAENFTVFIPEAAVAKFKEAKIDDPREYFKGKKVRVTGTVTAFKDKAQIKVETPDQIVLVKE